MTVSAEIKSLRKLQREDRRVVGIERRLEAIPRSLKEFETDLSKLEKMLDAEKDKLAESREFETAQKRQLEDEEEHVRNSKARINQIKTPRELAAAQREVESTRKMAAARTQELERIREAIEQAEARIGGMEKGLEELRAQVDVEREKLVAEQKELEEKLAKANAKRTTLTAKIDRELLREYERIRKRGGGVAFVPAHRRHCMACNVHVPHQGYVVLRRGDEILRCESCGRLLYWSGHFPKERDRLDAALKARKANKAEA